VTKRTEVFFKSLNPCNSNAKTIPAMGVPKIDENPAPIPE
jgi:hypothetical protein